MKPSAKLILAALRRGEVLTPQIALLKFGCMSLSQRIGEIRRDSSVTEEIICRRVKGDVYNEYFIRRTEPARPERKAETVVRAHVRRLSNDIDAEPVDIQQNLFG